MLWYVCFSLLFPPCLPPNGCNYTHTYEHYVTIFAGIQHPGRPRDDYCGPIYVSRQPFFLKTTPLQLVLRKSLLYHRHPEVCGRAFFFATLGVGFGLVPRMCFGIQHMVYWVQAGSRSEMRKQGSIWNGAKFFIFA